MVDTAKDDCLTRARVLLAQSPVPAVRELTVDRQGDFLLIHGRVATFYHKQLAQEAIRPAADGMRLVNAVDVED